MTATADTAQAPNLAPARRSRSVAIRGTRWPVILPSVHDARLHTAAVVMTIHLLGQVTLGFAVSVPQIASAIAASALLELGIAARREQRIVWPASAMLTGSGVGLIMRVEGTAAGDHWSWHRWWLFAAVAVASLLTKYAIRWRGRHLFNPSNLGLVAAFVILGSDRVEPLPFYWDAIGPGMVIAYVVIIVGGILITWRLDLLWMAAAFWATLTAGLAILAQSGHCMVVAWSLRPVCDGRFWWNVIVSPEVFVFVFFMLTDPRTVPTKPAARLAFAVAVGAIATLLIAPQRTEFGAKVALLGALTITCAAQPLIALASPIVRPRWWRATQRFSADLRGAIVGATIVGGVAVFAAGVVHIGASARTADTFVQVDEALPILDDILVWSAPESLPTVTAAPDALLLDPRFGESATQQSMAIALLRALAVENELLRRGDADLLAAVDHGARLAELGELIDNSAETGEPIPSVHYDIETMRLVTRRIGRQAGPVVAAEASGSRTAAGETSAWSAVISLRQAADGRWLIVDLDESTPADPPLDPADPPLDPVDPTG